jgi:polyhydroxyalkanoate synthesis regulator protein
MLIHEGLLPIHKPISYPLSGEIGIDRDLFWSIKISERYGVETTTLLQLFGKNEKGKTMLSEESFVQVDLGINMDQPLAEGKPPREVLAGVRRMSEDIIAAAFQIMGRQMRETWESSTEFMRMFGEFQRHSIERWMQAHDTRLITGGIGHEDLRRTVYAVVKEHADNFFLEESFLKKMWREFRESLYHHDEGFMPPINDIRDDMGNKFNELREQLINAQERIYPVERAT